MVRLLVRARNVERVYEFEKDVVAVGRAEDNDLRVHEPESSRHHCKFEKGEDGVFRLIDLGSRNGTLVNGLKVSAKVLEPGDAIVIGGTSIFYERLPTELTGDTVASDAVPDETVVFAERIDPPDIGTGELEKYRKLFEINKAITRELDVKKVLERVLDAAIHVTGAERGFLLLMEKGELKMRVSRNVDRETVKRAEGKVSKSVLKEVVTRGVALRIDDAGRDDRFRMADSVVDMNLASILAAPLKTREGVIGAIYLDNRFKKGSWTDAHLGLLDVISDQAAIAVENARLFEENLAKQAQLTRAHAELEELNNALKAKVESQSIELVEVRSLLEERRREYQLKFNYDAIVTRSPKMLEIFAILDRVTDSTVPVLVQGESGTGKELIARALHFNGPRKAKQFVSQNCAAIPGSLMESEFFGHVRGAFTGAEREKPGLFEIADGGTIFLDEIGDMDLDMQTKLLRVLQGGELRRVGAKEFKKVDVRVISATNRDLQQLIRIGKFREDLYYRLNVINVHLPPLRERREDIPVLAGHFLERARARTDAEPREVTEEAMRLLMRYDWPGNIRELENEVERMNALSQGRIGPELLSPAIASAKPRDPTGISGVFGMAGGLTGGGMSGGTGSGDKPLDTLELRDLVQRETESIERRAIAEALRRTKWKKTEAAAMLGISRPTLDAKIEKYGLTKDATAAAGTP
jgi:transcriptional regulator with GAF, ATPase, and Fis domain